MRRNISEQYPAIVELLSVDKPAEIRTWLREMAIRHHLRWLLAHADDGIIWGENRADRLATSDEITPEISPPLRISTLRQARLFSDRGELQIWREDDDWKGCLIREARGGDTPTFTESIDEMRILWGTEADPLDANFTRFTDGGQGLRHTVPLTVDGSFKPGERPLRLRVRHYLGEDDFGLANIVASRLVDLCIAHR